jgi:hypothetical protein
VKKWSAKLTAAQRELLERLPTGGADFDGALEAHEAVARAFATQARAIAAAHEVAWPTELEAATLRHLKAHGLVRSGRAVGLVAGDERGALASARSLGE